MRQSLCVPGPRPWLVLLHGPDRVRTIGSTSRDGGQEAASNGAEIGSRRSRAGDGTGSQALQERRRPGLVGRHLDRVGCYHVERGTLEDPTRALSRTGPPPIPCDGRPCSCWVCSIQERGQDAWPPSPR